MLPAFYNARPELASFTRPAALRAALLPAILTLRQQGAPHGLFLAFRLDQMESEERCTSSCNNG